MAHSFIAYIDESGDDGLRPTYRSLGESGGSSNWLTVSASIWRFSRDLDAIQWRDEICDQFPPNNRRREIHCKKLDHNQRVMASGLLASKPIRAICVIAHKPSLRADTFTSSNQLYFYMCRYLLERISWFCRSARRIVPEGDGRVKIVFSRRGGLQYQNFKSYMDRLKNCDDQDIQINWPVIDIPGIEAVDHSTRAGLQIADIIATCVTAGLEPTIYGNCELRYSRILRPLIYERNGNYLSYGMKLVPRMDTIPFNEEQRAFVALFERER